MEFAIVASLQGQLRIRQPAAQFKGRCALLAIAVGFFSRESGKNGKNTMRFRSEIVVCLLALAALFLAANAVDAETGGSKTACKAAVDAAFEEIGDRLDRQREEVRAETESAISVSLTTTLSEWGQSSDRRAELRPVLGAELSRRFASSALDALFLVEKGGEVFWSLPANLAPQGDARETVRQALLTLTHPFFKGAEAAVGTAWFSLPSGDVDAEPKPALFLIAMRPVSPGSESAESPTAIVVGLSSMEGFGNSAREVLADSELPLEWHLFARSGTDEPAVIGGDRVGATVSIGMFEELRRSGESERGGLFGADGIVGHWGALAGFGSTLTAGWGVTVDAQAAAETPDPEEDSTETVTGFPNDVSEGDFEFIETDDVDSPEPAAAEPLPPVDDPVGEADSPDSEPVADASTAVEPTETQVPVSAAKPDPDVPPQPRENDLRPDQLQARDVDVDAPVSATEPDASAAAFNGTTPANDTEVTPPTRKVLAGDDDPAARAVVAVAAVLSILAILWLIYAIAIPKDPPGRVVNTRASARTQQPTRVQTRVADRDVEGLIAQFEVNWKTFASYTQDLLHQNLKEIQSSQTRELESLRTEVGKVSQTVQATTPAAANTEALQSFTERVQSEVAKLSVKLDQVSESQQAARSQEVEATNRAVAEENARLVEELAEARKAEATLRDLIDEATRREAQLQEEFDAASEERESLTRRLLEVDDSLKEKLEQNERLTRELETGDEHLVGQLRQRDDEIESLRRDLEASRTGGDPGGEIQALQQENGQLRSDLAACRRTHGTLTEDKVRLETELTELRCQVESQPMAEGSAQWTALTEENEDLRTSLERTRVELTEAQDKLIAVEQDRRGLETQVATLESKAETANAEGGKLQDAERTIQDLQSQLEESESSVQKLKTELEQDRAEVRSRSVILKSVESLEGEKKDLRRTLEKVEKELENVRAEADEIRLFQGTLVESSFPAAIVGIDPSLKVFAWNPRATSLWGRNEQDVHGRVLAALALDGVDTSVIDQVRSVLQSGTSSDLGDASFKNAAGKTTHVRLQCDPIQGPDGRALGAVLLAEDVTQRTEKELDARLQSLFNESLVRSLPAALVVTDTRGRVISWNQSATDVLGVGEKEALGSDLFALDTALSKDVFRKRFEDNKSKRAPSRLRVRLESAAGPKTFLLTQSPFLGDDDSVRGTILFLQEVAVPDAAK